MEQQFTIWFDPQGNSDIENPEDFDRLAEAYGLDPAGRSCPPGDNQERWTATYRGDVRYMHVLNTWALGGYRHLVYRGAQRLNEEETFDWITRRANARMQSTSLH